MPFWFLACLLLVLLWVPPVLAQHDDDEVRAEAKALFDVGLERARLQDYEASLKAFEEAYRLQPHSAVLFNIARAQEELGRDEEALKSFRAYLDESGDFVDAARRAEVEERMRLLRLRLEEVQAARSAASDDSAEFENETSRDTEAEPNRTVPQSATFGEHQHLERQQAGGVSEKKTHKPRTLSTVAVVAVSAGLTGLGTSLGLHLWNHGRFRKWKHEAQRISALPGDDPERPQLQEASNERLLSIHEMDKVSLVIAGTSAVVLATGTALWLTTRRANVSVGLGRVEVYGQF